MAISISRRLFTEEDFGRYLALVNI